MPAPLRPAALAELRALVRGELYLAEPLARHTSLQIGGPADALIVPADPEEIASLLGWCGERGIACFVLGRGSNLLAGDGPHHAVFLKLAGTLREVALDGTRLRAGSGASTPGLARLAVAHGLAGLEFACGIPGTLGGAVTMNAGVGTEWIGPAVREVRVLRPGGSEARLARGSLRFGYRESDLGGAPGLVCEATLDLAPGDREELRERMAAWQRHRRDTQPLQLPNAGSMFRNPPGDHAGRLIEAAGAKGWREGAVEISTLHANFVVNHGGGTAAGVLALMWREWRAVRARFGVELRTEIHVVGLGGETELIPGMVRATDYGQPVSEPPAPAGPAPS